VAFAGGPFGPPQPIHKDGGGLHTAIGYWYQQDTYANGAEYATRQNQIYSEAGYGSRDRWEVYARIGLSDLKISDAFASQASLTVPAKNDFTEGWKFFSTLGMKGFYPLNETFGIGAFLQGTYSFSDYTDNVSGTSAGAPFTVEVAVKGLWDVRLGVGLQATLPSGVKAYAGPYAGFSEATLSPSAFVAGMPITAGETTIKTKTNLGGYAGIEVPLAKGFRLNVEGQYADRLSVGIAVPYVY
jgi:hypothetical protein